MKAIGIVFSAFIFLLLIAATQSSERIISGIVTDAKSHDPLPGVHVRVTGYYVTVQTDSVGKYKISLPKGATDLTFLYLGYKKKVINVAGKKRLDVSLEEDNTPMEEVVVKGNAQRLSLPRSISGMVNPISGGNYQFKSEEQTSFNTESYNAINENRFLTAKENPLSTFGIDVDAASYSNIRRFINNGQLPPIDAVRIEEMLNYFDYDYPQPLNGDPVSINTEISAAPWNREHKLIKIGLQAKTIATDNLPASNLVFLIDVSGSMDAPNKLPLVKSSMKLLVDQLRAKDRVAIVVYASATGLVLESTSGANKAAIKDAINKLEAGGSTAGGAGIQLAYKVALDHLIKGGNNRVILATDGDFNIGVSSDAEMQRLAEDKKQSGIALTVLGYGMGNYKDSKMETLADKGNGNYAYIDNISEAKKTLVNEFGGTLFTVANDVKLQVEFNPAQVQAYRLIGYENRMLNKEDFNNDKKDAGDLGSGHRVTALYEIIPTGIKSKFIEKVDDLKYQNPQGNQKASAGNELINIKLRYKSPGKPVSRMIEHPVINQEISWSACSDNFRFAAAVAGYGMLLRNSEFKQETSYSKVIDWAENALGKDKEGYRSEFLKLVKSSQLMAKDLLSVSEK